VANDTNTDRGKAVSWIAIAGITATAIVGVAGTATSWLIARDDRATQRALAHDARIFDERAAVYVDALVLIERQELEIYEREIERHQRRGNRSEPTEPLMLADSTTLPRIRAYGSLRALRAYEVLLAVVKNFYNDEFFDPQITGTTRQAQFNAKKHVFQQAVRDDLR
jgi:hypothetical protein